MGIHLTGPFAGNAPANESDVKQMKKALNRLGYYMPHAKTGITGIPDRAVFAGLKAFQKDQGLHPSGEARPGDETIKRLDKAAGEKQGYYIWHTKGDDKVRASHAALDGTIRAWSDSPDPREEPNCRCWAENIKKCFVDEDWMDEAIKNLKNHEGGPYAWPYLDTNQKITVGWGSNIDRKDIFTQLPWKIDDGENGRKATEEEVEIGYKALRQKAHEGKKPQAKHQKDITNLRLSQSEIEELFKRDFKYFTEKLEKIFDDFICFPPPAKVALVDMIYNTGETRFNRQVWKNFFPAVYRRDWETAALECHRFDVSEDRNTHTYDQFLDAQDWEDGTEGAQSGE